MEETAKRGFAAKHRTGEQPNPAVEKRLREHAADGQIPCAAAFEIADALGVTPALVGKTMDLMNLRLVKCQLGLFGYPPVKKKVKPVKDADPKMVQAVEGALTGGRLTCRRAWELAAEWNVPKMRIAGICEAAGFKIKSCQLGAF